MADTPDTIADQVAQVALNLFKAGEETVLVGEKVPLKRGDESDDFYRASGFDSNPDRIRVQWGTEYVVLDRFALKKRLWAHGIKVFWQDKRGGTNLYAILEQGGPEDGYFGPRIR